MSYSVQDSRELMEYLVNQALVEWQVYNINADTENYMGEAEINSAVIYIIKKVMMELTDISKEKLSVGFPMNTEEEMIESIKNRAKLAVLNYSIKQNQPQEESAESIKNINSF